MADVLYAVGNSTRSILVDQQRLHKLLRDSWRASPTGEGEPLRLQQKSIRRRHIPRLQQRADDGEIALLVRLAKINPEAEALGKGGLLLDGFVPVDIAALTVGKPLVDDMPPVAGGIDGNVFRARRRGALEYGFEHAAFLVAFRKGKVVQIQHKAQRVVSKLFEYGRDQQ